MFGWNIIRHLYKNTNRKEAITSLIINSSIPSRLVRCNKKGHLFENIPFEELSALNFPVQKNHMYVIPINL